MSPSAARKCVKPLGRGIVNAGDGNGDVAVKVEVKRVAVREVEKGLAGVKSGFHYFANVAEHSEMHGVCGSCAQVRNVFGDWCEAPMAPAAARTREDLSHPASQSVQAEYRQRRLAAGPVGGHAAATTKPAQRPSDWH